MADDPAVVFHALMNTGAFNFHCGRILPAGIYGFQLVVKPYMRNQGGFGWVTNIVSNAGWLISGQRTEPNGDEVFLLEPSHWGQPVLGRLLYHVTPIVNVPGILAKGIEPRTGGTTWLGRTYPARSHHALTLWDAMCFLDTSWSKSPSVGGPGIVPAKDLANYEILEFAPPDGTDFWVDAWMTGACWTETLIPPAGVSISPEWRQRYQSVALWR